MISFNVYIYFYFPLLIIFSTYVCVSAPMNSHRAQPRLGAIIVKSNPAKQINCSAQQKAQQPTRRMRNTPGVHEKNTRTPDVFETNQF